MAYGRLAAISEDDAQHVTFSSQLDMTEGIDPALDRHQASVGQPVVDRIRSEPEMQQLPARHHAMLATRQRVDVRLDLT